MFIFKLYRLTELHNIKKKLCIYNYISRPYFESSANFESHSNDQEGIRLNHIKIILNTN